MLSNFLLGVLLAMCIDLNFSQKNINTPFITSMILILILIFDVFVRSLK